MLFGVFSIFPAFVNISTNICFVCPEQILNQPPLLVLGMSGTLLLISKSENEEHAANDY